MIDDKYHWLIDNLDDREPIVQFGIECDIGWTRLLHSLFEELTHIDKTKSTRITQIKEKFGTLRVYYILTHPVDEVVERLIQICINTAEQNSSHVCEKCGHPGTLKSNERHRVTCSPCEAQYQKNKLGD